MPFQVVSAFFKSQEVMSICPLMVALMENWIIALIMALFFSYDVCTQREEIFLLEAGFELGSPLKTVS